MTKPETRFFVRWERPDSRLVLPLVWWLGLAYPPLVLLQLVWALANHVAAQLGDPVSTSELLGIVWTTALQWNDRPTLAACFYGPLITLGCGFTAFTIAAGIRVNRGSGT